MVPRYKVLLQDTEYKIQNPSKIHNPKSIQLLRHSSVVRARRAIMSKQKAHGTLIRIGSNPIELDRHWDKMFHRLQGYEKKHGDFLVPVKYAEDPQLGQWLRRQRDLFRKGTIRKDRKQKLESIGVDLECHKQLRNDIPWNKKYDELQNYYHQHGNYLVPEKYEENPRLASWVSVQRSKWRQNVLSRERKAKLDAINFQWTPGNRAATATAAARWEANYNMLVDFQQTNGHCRVPTGHILYSWTQTQRGRRFLSSDRDISKSEIDLLDSIGFEWAPRDFGWNEELSLIHI